MPRRFDATARLFRHGSGYIGSDAPSRQAAHPADAGQARRCAARRAACLFEPKWDGFRALVFRDGDEIHIQSRDEKPLNRYFPELVDALRSQLPERCVLDGEIVIATSRGLDFDVLQLRLHPPRRACRCSPRQTPSSIVFFDLLCGRRPRSAWRRRSRSAARSCSGAGLRRAARAPDARDARSQCGRRLVSALRRRRPRRRHGQAAVGVYEPNKRVMLKVKHERDCDCVVGGLSLVQGGPDTAVGSLLLGLYDDVGASAARRRLRELHRREAPRAGRIPRALPRRTRWRIIRGRSGPATKG